MPLDFPTSPALNEIYTFGGRSWIWNGTAWDVYSTVSGSVVTTLNGLSGGVTLAAGSNITLSPVGNTITIASSGGGGGGSGNNFTESTSAPTPFFAGDRWFDTDEGNLYTAVTDDSGLIWVQLNAGIVGASGPAGNTGATGAQGPQGNTGATGPVGDYVISLRGLTGTIGITNGSGIGLSVSGQTLTFSNTGVLSFNGLTGAVTGVTTGTTNTFGPLQSFTNGISSSGGTFSALTRFTAGISSSFVRTLEIQGPGGAYPFFTDGALRLQQLGFPSNNFTTLISSSTTDQIITLPDDTGTVALTKNVVSSLNGLTGTIGISAGSNITITKSGNTLTIASTASGGSGGIVGDYVISVDGATGAVNLKPFIIAMATAL